MKNSPLKEFKYQPIAKWKKKCSANIYKARKNKCEENHIIEQALRIP